MPPFDAEMAEPIHAHLRSKVGLLPAACLLGLLCSPAQLANLRSMPLSLPSVAQCPQMPRLHTTA